VLPPLTEVVKVNDPLPVTERLLEALSCRISPLPERPEIVPPIVKVGGGVRILPVPVPPLQDAKQMSADTPNASPAHLKPRVTRRAPHL